MMFLVANSACESSSVVGTILFIKKIMKIISIVIPVILVLLLTIDFTKAVIANDENDMKQAQSMAIKRIIYALIVFFVPIIVDASFNLVGRSFNTLKCYRNATDEKVKELRQKEQQEEEQRKREQQQQQSNNNSSNNSSSNNSSSNNSSSNNSSSNNSSSNNSSSKPSNNSSNNTASGTPSCTLTYNDVNDKLTFSTTKNAVSYSIVKTGRSPAYSSSKPVINPGSDRTNSTANYVTITYKGYVKNKNGVVRDCTKTVKVSRGAAAVAYGKTFLGKRYCHWQNPNRKNWFGQKNLVCTDCSGFVGGIYIHLGKKGFSRDDDTQCKDSYAKTYKVSGRNSSKGAKIGDIVCFGKTRSNGTIDYVHVALYLGETKNGRVKILQMGGGHGKANIDTRSTWVKIMRVKDN